MNKIIYTTLIVIVSITVFGQQAKPLKFGFELDGELKKTAPHAPYDSPTGVAYIGMFSEFHVINHLSGKLRVGLNNTYYHVDGYNYSDINGEMGTYPEINTIKQTLNVGFEPRFYFFSMKKVRKINVYAALPVVFETAPPINSNDFYFYVSSRLMFIPTLGIRYDFAKHFGIEASVGYGKGWYFPKHDLLKKEQKEYRLSAGLRYAF